ncbi:two-partner secretion domain-containing protein [Vacuolonema iberomarrocanum]|uniref:two-partner secretion domain-containing protein n=1 Tax=Vacuolonema iberomarrocanum TaxID=3454632 RepID=UPI003F6DBAD2
MTLPATAQLPLEADDTLGDESSLVVPLGPGSGFFLIEGGAARGGNLFHSFGEFNVNENGGVIFVDPAAIDNVIARVTGENPSNILGTLGMFSDANLFLLNPNGIFFGDNAQLLMEGSFLASTADSLIFPNDPDFSAANPDPNALLSINVPIGLQFGDRPAPITNEAILNVSAERSLVLAGGPVTLDNGNLSPFVPNDTETPSGRVEVAAIGSAGRVDLSVDGSELALRLPETLQRANIILQNNSFIGALGSGGGAIALYGDNVSILDGSTLSLGIGQALGGANNRLGAIRVNATGQVVLDGGSMIQNGIFTGGTGIGGTIRINAAELDVREGSSILTFSDGSGDAGDIRLRVSDRLLLTGTGATETEASQIASSIFSNGVGSSGTIDIATAELQIQNGAGLETNVQRTGNAGNIRIRARDHVRISGVSETGVSASSIFSFSQLDGTGASGNITITTQDLEVLDGAAIATETSGIGDTGNITLRASGRVWVSGVNDNNETLFSFVRTGIAPGSTAQGGDITIETAVLEVQDGARLNTTIFGTGDGGDITLRASERIRLSDSSSDGQTPVSVFSGVGSQGEGEGGTIRIRTPVLEVLDGTVINAATFGTGDAGDIQIRASDRLLLAGTTVDGLGSSITSQVEPDAEGDGGIVDIRTGTLEIRDSSSIGANTAGRGDGGTIDIRTRTLEFIDVGFISANTAGRGDAGDIIIRARDRILVSGTIANEAIVSRISSNVNSTGVGAGGNIQIRTRVLEASDGAQIAAATFGRGDAGDVEIHARDRIRLSGATPDGRFLTSVVTSVEPGARGNGGDINITTSVLEMQDGAQINAATLSEGNSGNVVIRARDRATFFNTRTDDSIFTVVASSVEPTATGRGGNLRIRTPLLEVSDGAALSASTRGSGDAGNIFIRTDRAIFSNGGRAQSAVGDIADDTIVSPNDDVTQSLVNEDAVGDGGDIDITTGELQLLDGGRLIASTAGEGDAGEVRVRARDRLVISGNQPGRSSASSGILTRVDAGAIGDGGAINIDSPQVNLEGGILSARSEGDGIGGNILISADTLQLDDAASIDTETLSTDGGNIALTIDDLLLLRENSLISTEAGTAQSGGDGGDITVNNSDGFIVAVPEENSDIVANAFEGRGGNIRITTQGIFGLEFRDERTPLSDITASSEIGVDGDVEIITPNLDPTQGLVELPAEVVDAADQIGQVCPTGPGSAAQLGRFVVTGRGGISPSPLNVLDDPDITVDWLEDREIIPTEELTPTENETSPIPQSQQDSAPLVEANGWLRSEDGLVQLVAAVSDTDEAIAPTLQHCP